MRNELLLYANYYHNLGMNVLPIYSEFKKNPDSELFEKYSVENQSLEVVKSFDWNKSSGIGIVLGVNGFAALDIDSLCDNSSYYLFPERRKEKVEEFVTECLTYLSLPLDYEWVVNSGSGYGLHIIFKTAESYEKSKTFSYSPKQSMRRYYDWEQDCFSGTDEFRRIELLFNDFLVLPPSEHISGNQYNFYRNTVPCAPPQLVSIDKVLELINHFCGDLYFEPCSYKELKVSLARIKKELRNPSSYDEENFFDEIEDNIPMLLSCSSKDALNSLGVCYALGKGINANLDKAKDLFTLANNEMAHYNLASLMACKAIEGSSNLVNFHLSKCSDFPSDELMSVRINLLCKPIEKNQMGVDNTSIPKEVTKFLFFDTETTGVPLDYNAATNDVSNWPRLVQLGWIITDDCGNIIKSQNHIVYPTDFIIPHAATLIHGITTEKAKDVGLPIKDIFTEFMLDFNNSNFVVGHNISFDKKIIGAELIRMNEFDTMDTKKSFCTMELGTAFCGLIGRNGNYKYPKLQELYYKLFNSHFNNAHNAIADVEATVKCFWKMVERGIIDVKMYDNNTSPDALPF